MSVERTDIEALSPMGLFEADMAYLDAQSDKSPQAGAVRCAIAAYVKSTAGESSGIGLFAGPVQFVTTLPDHHADLPGGQILHRSFDHGVTWEVCTRPDTYSTWSLGIASVTA